MPLDRQRAQKYLQTFDFESLFIEELGWDTVDRVTLPFEVDGEPFDVVSIAQKRGFTVFKCITPEIPLRPIRVKLDRQLTDYSKSHLLVFGDECKTQQIWMWVRQEPGKPLAPRFEQYQVGQSAERLLQKLEALAIAFAEEEKLTLVEVAQRVKKAFDVEKVTKKFFTRFEKEHEQFLKFIEGIQSEFDRTWYASLMLNRLMFVYFIQKKNFLDGDINYLRNRLKRCQTEWGTDTFHSFYRQFLLKLFHEGLGKPDRNPELDQLLGKIPYLNGGLFEVHQLEEKYDSTLQIPDAAFEQVFNFFDEYDWHLDDRPLRNQNEINPDVLGYIFEKYINQKQMGAYYTKEDITEYISKNTIIPFLFDAAKKRCPAAFKPPHPLTPSPKAGEGGQETPAPLSRSGRGAGGEGNSGDESNDYWEISPALRQRMAEIAREFRKQPTPSEAILWQALRGRRLDGRKFKRQQPIGAFIVDFFCGAERLIVEVDGAVHETQQEYDQQRQELLELLGLRFVRVSSQQVETDLNGVLEIIRAAFRPHPLTPSPKQGEGEPDSSLAPLSPPRRGAGGEGLKPRYEYFRKVLAEMAKHPNPRYFVLKSIVLNNLYGVDIMEEATEICKLRLFLKLVAQMEPQPKKQNFGLEPLPDIDFNIRAGNTLVGFASLDEVRKAIKQDGDQLKLDLQDDASRINEKAELADRAFQRFRQMQTEFGMDAGDFRTAKKELRRRLAELNEELNHYLAREYGVDVNKPAAFEKWRNSHQPFHWFVEFYSIIDRGGFDVIIGNPPYVEYRIIQKNYRIKNYISEDANNLYAFCMERATKLLSQPSWLGMIVPTSVVGLDDTSSLRSVLLDRFSLNICSTYSIRPSKLFEGVDQRLCIYLGRSDKTKGCRILSSKYYHWSSDERDILFSNLEYSNSFIDTTLNRIAQTGNIYSTSILKKLKFKDAKLISTYYCQGDSGYVITYHRSPRYWIKAIDFEPYFRSPDRSRSIHHIRDLHFSNEEEGKFAGALLNSSLFFFWFISLGNGRNITGSDIHKMPVGEIDSHLLKEISTLFDKLMRDYQENSFVRIRQDCEFQEFRQSLSKPIIDEIDRGLAQHYGFTDEELDFIINYDIKYRMGRDSGGDD